MSVEENLKVVDASTKAANDHDLDRFESFHLNSVIQRDPANPGNAPLPRPSWMRQDTPNSKRS